MKDLVESINEVRRVLVVAKSDIAYWLQLAEKQCDEMPRVEYVAYGPCIEGMNQSKRVIEQICKVMRDLPRADQVENMLNRQ